MAANEKLFADFSVFRSGKLLQNVCSLNNTTLIFKKWKTRAIPKYLCLYLCEIVFTHKIIISTMTSSMAQLFHSNKNVHKIYIQYSKPILSFSRASVASTKNFLKST